MRKSSKYRAKPTVIDGIRFASRREAKRYCQLRLLSQAGAIASLTLQPRYPLTVNGVLVCTYVADFRYWDARESREVVEDAKGFRTREYLIKRKLVQAVYGIQILET